MSDQQKRPAHEVILTELGSAVEMLNSSQWYVAVEGLHRLEVLCDVLAEMVIPEGERTEVAGKVWSLWQVRKMLHNEAADKALTRAYEVVMGSESDSGG